MEKIYPPKEIVCKSHCDGCGRNYAWFQKLINPSCPHCGVEMNMEDTILPDGRAAIFWIGENQLKGKYEGWNMEERWCVYTLAYAYNCIL